MKPASFDYLAPGKVEEALSLLSQYGEEAKVLAGGQSLIPLMKLRLVRPKYLIDINRIEGISNIQERDGGILIGAMTRHQQIETTELIRAKIPLLAEAASLIGNPQVRNRGTIGGSLCHADPMAEFPVATIALGAEFRVAGPKGERVVKAKEFFIDFLTTALEPTEVLKEVFVPSWPGNTGWAFTELRRRHVDPGLVAVAVMLTLDDSGTCEKVNIALAGVGMTPIMAKGAEEAIKGKRIEEKLSEEVAKHVSGEIQPESDVHASAQYRQEMATILTRRALKTALDRARDKAKGGVS